MNLGVAVGTKFGSLQVFDDATFAKSMKTLGDGGGVDEVARAQDAHDMSVEIANFQRQWLIRIHDATVFFSSFLFSFFTQ